MGPAAVNVFKGKTSPKNYVFEVIKSIGKKDG